MHMALIVDEERLMQEHAMLQRLSISLISEGVRLTRIVPEGADAEETESTAIPFAGRLEIPMRVLPWLRKDRARRLAEATEQTPLDVIYAVGESSWTLAQDLAETLGRPLALDIWSAEQIRRAPQGRSLMAAYIVPTLPLAELLRKRVSPELVSLVPMGVALPSEPRRVLEDVDRTIALAVAGSGRDLASYRALLDGLAKILAAMPQAQVFLELRGPYEHEIWRYARRLSLHEQISVVASASQYRSMLMRCDALLVPEGLGEARSITLDVLAHGIPVLAAEDPWLEFNVGVPWCITLPRPNAEAWAEAVARLLADPESARRVGLAGRTHAARSNRSSAQASLLLSTFGRMIGGDAYPFAKSVVGQ